ncbi:MAG: hypothetical protein R6U20_11950 [Longimonas sp.]|uniref:hypothetical protein n=1 Tax=Longimonas sp. TaxID=2039626 RepID=UPI0039747E2A
MSTASTFAFVPEAWEALRAEAMRAEQTVAVHPDVARWRAYRALDMVLATIEAYEGFPPQHRPLAERLTHKTFVQWLNMHPAPVKMWMHRIRQAGMVGAHVDSEWTRSVEDACRVIETLHKLLWWLVDTYDSVPAARRPSITWGDLDRPTSGTITEADAQPATTPSASHASTHHDDESARASLPPPNVTNDTVRAWLRQVRSAPLPTDTSQQAAARLLKHIHTTNETLLSHLSPDA